MAESGELSSDEDSELRTEEECRRVRYCRPPGPSPTTQIAVISSNN